MEHKRKIILGIPALSIDFNFFTSMLNVINANILYGWAPIAGTLLPMARNKCIEMAYENQPDFTHFVFVDSDMGNFHAGHILKLVEADKPVVSALVCMRKPPFYLVIDFGDNTATAVMDHINNRRVVKSAHVGMGFTCMTREVLDKTREDTENGPIWFNCDREPREDFDEEKEKFIDSQINSIDSENAFGNTRVLLHDAIAFGQASHLGSKILGEDISFSRKCTKLNIPMYVHCGVSVAHVGDAPYDFRDTVLNSKVEEEKPELQIVTP